MEKRKRWQFYLILGVLILTVYNILPTVFYYSKSLKKPIGEQQARTVSLDIIDRVNGLEAFTLSWLKAQSKNLGLKPIDVRLDKDDPRLAYVEFKSEEDAAFFAKTLFRAGTLIPFAPAQLSPDPSSVQNSKTVVVQRKIGVHLNPQKMDDIFYFVPKRSLDGRLTEAYRSLVGERAAEIALGFGGTTQEAKLLEGLGSNSNTEDLFKAARKIVEYETAFGDGNPIAQRFFAGFTQASGEESSSEMVHRLIARLEKLGQTFSKEIAHINEEKSQRKEKGQFLEGSQQQRLEILESQKAIIDSALTIVRRNAAVFENGLPPLTYRDIEKKLEQNKSQTIPIGDRNPFISSLEINWGQETIHLVLHPDVLAMREWEPKGEAEAVKLEKLNQLLFSEVAAAARKADETIKPSFGGFAVKLNQLTNSSSLLVLDLGTIAKEQIASVTRFLQTAWKPATEELNESFFPVHPSFSAFKRLTPREQKLGFVFYAPVFEEKTEPGFRKGSIYVIARGMGMMREKYLETKRSQPFEEDFRALQSFLKQNGFIGYPGNASDLPPAFKDDYIFELDDYASYLVAATREHFSIKGKKRAAVLEFTDVEQRILALNRIQTEIHEDLVKWRDEYRAAQVSIYPEARYDVPPPTKSVVWSNLKLSALKYLRGDERKILKWGLDLSGGKTVRVGLKDENNQPITSEVDLKQAMNELYQRVNRLGVSEVGIRVEGPTVVLDFPGSQGLAASDLIQASAMYFHVVNEKFTAKNPALNEAVNAFLDEVWNEAVITSRTDPESINEIAWRHLGGDPDNPDEFRPLTSHARLLYDHGLRLAGPRSLPRSSNFNDILSSVAIFRGSDYADWQGQTYPLLIVFHNYALEGANLDDVHAGYDPSEGNVLNFTVQGSHTNRAGQKVNPRDDFYAWTSQFSEEKIAGTPKEEASQGKGWRMAVILNGTIINAPTLNAALRESARISGHFSQREINQLAADLKAGSLSFTPYILSEENVSPDLGQEQRAQGIFAATLGLLLVIAVMCAYYRWSGVIASAAVLINLLIIWGVLQNLGATITLPGLAGIILAIGMSVDANVLVFERIREEFSSTGRLPLAVQAGYRKAFSAIFDSNLTTIIAALILLNFDSGPIKGFALTLIIGIVSSMFTSLFMTRFFFAGWVQNPKHQSLKMAHLFGETRFNFLRYAKAAFAVSACFILIGVFFLAKEKNTIFGMDFTGGYALTVDLSEKPGTDYRLAAMDALASAGAAPSDFQIQELNKPNQLRIQLGTSLDQPGKPFYEIEQAPKPEKALFPYQNEPRIRWIADALENGRLHINPATLPQLNLHWTEMSSQMSDTMRNQAMLGLGLALLSILIYITIRFEFKYAISATIALLHDLLITLGVLALLHAFFEGIRIDLQVIAALMTIVGYSLNDTIIIFDRIREDLRLHSRKSFSNTINHALNATLSRTLMTSGTTLSALIALVLFGGSSIFNFSLIMTLGVIFGTLSSIYIASPLLLYFHGKEKIKHQQGAKHQNSIS